MDRLGHCLGSVILALVSTFICTLNEDLAASTGLNPRRESYALTIGLAIVVAVGLKL